MNKETRHLINLVLAAVATAMGVAVIVLSILNSGISSGNYTTMLAIAVAAIGLLELNNISKDKKS